MIERGSGRIINISSITGEIGNIGQANYAASKSGLFGFTKTLAREAAFALAKADRLSADGIGLTVNAVTPGLIETEMTAAVPAKVIESFKTAIPMRRMGRPEEIARVVAFLAADASAVHHRPGLGRQRRPRYVRRFRRSGGALRGRSRWALQARALGGAPAPVQSAKSSRVTGSRATMFSVTVAVLIWILSSRAPATYARAAAVPMCRPPRTSLARLSVHANDGRRRARPPTNGVASAGELAGRLVELPDGVLGQLVEHLDEHRPLVRGQPAPGRSAT